ncbi:MAG: MerR family transcriptional regulator [Leeuwenhoekiella sp.]
MHPVKTQFSIRDLESLGGIKAHTIRIWEKRYNLLEPDRTATNIRTYSLKDLQKLLNVIFLLENEYKISKVARHNSAEIAEIVADLVAKNNLTNNHAIISLKIAMMNFDQRLFAKTYESLATVLSFRQIFMQAFVPLLNELGFLWQTDTINPAHEHFITNLIKMKILLQIEQYQLKHPPTKSKTFVLFLPENEIHELGLMFLNYEIISRGYSCIFLGQSIQLESLNYVLASQSDVHFVSYFTIKPDDQTVEEYAKSFNEELSSHSIPFYILGKRALQVNEKELPDNVKVFKSLKAFTQLL